MEKNETKTMKAGGLNLFEFLNKIANDYMCSPCFYNWNEEDRSGLSISIEKNKVTKSFCEKLLQIQFDYNYTFIEKEDIDEDFVSFDFHKE